MESSDLLMVVPTRGRPESIKPIIRAWDQTEARCYLLFAVDDDDERLADYEAVLAAVQRPGVVGYTVGPRRRLAGTLNEVVRLFSPGFKAVGFMGDDHRPRTPGWDSRFAVCLSGGVGVVYGNDLLVGAKFPTAVMMTSDIPRTLGYMCPPGLVHLCLDLVWKDWGEGIGRITYLDDVVIEHLHPANGKAKMDAGYEEANSSERVATDSRAYLDYKENGALADDLVKLKGLL